MALPCALLAQVDLPRQLLDAKAAWHLPSEPSVVVAL